MRKKKKQKKKQKRSRTDRVVWRGLLFCATWWRKKEKIFGRGPIEWGDGCHVVVLKEKGLREQCVEDFCPVPRGGCDRKAVRACV